MAEPLSYKELENLVKDLKSERDSLKQEVLQKENSYLTKENLYHQVINNTHDSVVVLQGDSPKFMNKAALALFDVSKVEIDSVKFLDLIHPDFKANVVHPISQIVSGNIVTYELECDVLSQSGTVTSVKMLLKKLDDSNKITSVLIHIENIQDFKNKEQQLSNLQKTVDFVEKYIEEGLLLLSKSDNNENSIGLWKVEDINSTGCQILEINKEDIVGKALNSYVDIAKEISIETGSDDLFKEGIETYNKVLKKFLRIKFYSVTNSVVACKILDITELSITKEHLTKNLRRNEFFTEVLNIFNSEHSFDEKFSDVLERISYHFETKRIIVFSNNENGRQANITHQHSIKNVSLIHDGFVMPFKQVPSWNKELKERKMILGYSMEYLPEDLGVFLSNLKISNAYIFPILVEEEISGSVLFENKHLKAWDTTEINYLKMVTVLMSNLTSRYHYENKLLKAKEKAEEADRLKSSFLANMSHDIRIPMTAIIGFSDLLADPDLTIGEREEFVELISNSGQDLLTLIDNIVDVAKIETGQLKIKTDTVSLINLFNELYNNHIKDNKLINQDDLELKLELPEKFHKIPFETDAFRFKQVLNNLIDNAIKFTDKGLIQFGVSNVWPNNIEFFIQDTGIGIAENTQDVIFERFSKIDRSYTKEYNGTGLGLAICKSLVELMGGEMRLVSYPGKGSTFYFTHPLPAGAMESVSDNEQGKGIANKYNWEHITILVAEDVEQNYKFLEYIILPTKAKVVWAKNGKEALDYVKEEKPCDCILMDIRMPVLSGLDATKEILKLVDIPIIIQTAYTLGDEKDMALKLGCVDYISKPVHANLLLKTIAKYI